MSQESLSWHQVMSLIGNTAKRTTQNGWHKVQRIITADAGEQEVGGAWHYRATMQGDEPNHYYGPIPVEDVRRRLFSWTPEERSPLSVTDPESMLTLAREILSGEGDADAAKILAGLVQGSIYSDKAKDIVRPVGALGPDDPGARLNSTGLGFKIHGYDEWLVRNVETILYDENLIVQAAGLLREGAQAWVEVSIPETITSPAGIDFRPVLLAATSLDSSIATGYGMKTLLTVCDNTLSINLRDKTRSVKYKHTTNSLERLGDARSALALELVHDAADDFQAELDELTNTTVTDAEWGDFKNRIYSLADESGQPKEGNSRTRAINRQAELEKLYRHDPRCNTFAGTAFGVLQTVNTHRHHVATVKGMSRPLRNMSNAVEGKIDEMDASTLATLGEVIGRPLVAV